MNGMTDIGLFVFDQIVNKLLYNNLMCILSFLAYILYAKVGTLENFD